LGEALELLGEMTAARGLIPAGTGAVLLTRHSLRYESANDTPGFDVPLTPEGVALAEDWGRTLGVAVRGVFASPSPRCLETGSAMLRGACVQEVVAIAPLLREPGCYVREIALAQPHFRRLGPRQFMNGVLQGRIPGAAVAREATSRLLVRGGSRSA
jgi:broad specificity phosphatase PhoE